MTLAKRYTSNSHCVFNLGYHIVFCPKYRRKVLVDGVDERLKILLQQKADELGITLENMEVMPDHVHLFIRSKPTYAIHFVINQLKGYSSVCFRKEFPWLRSRLPSLWTRSYFVESVGHISEETVRKYIENRKECLNKSAIRGCVIIDYGHLWCTLLLYIV